ncbi:hypothetical protein WSM22_25540 [Cytophagales bacterium WSM2-2]|nr:hypothetical protein WSM22_25540 [Cytophagales bacterium WSM2-2]
MSQTNPHPDFLSDRHEFQIDRMILFSDAVFAIAITLLVIEMKVPILKVRNSHELTKALEEKIPEFLGFALSFAVIGQFWVTHHRLFGYITNYTQGLLWLNLHVLFWIALVPFTSGLNSFYGNLDIAWMVYNFNMLMISLSLFFIYRYAGNPDRKLSTLVDQPIVKKYSFQRSRYISAIFLLAILLCIPDWEPASWASRFVLFLIPIAISRVNNRARKEMSRVA